MSQPHLLYLAFFFPPSRASGVYRAVGTVRAFVEAGWRVTVITTTERFFADEFGSIDASLIDAVPKEADIVRVPFSFRETNTPPVHEMGWFRGNFPLLVASMARGARRLRSRWSVRRARSTESTQMDDRYTSWIEPVVARSRQIHATNRIDHVLATGNPYSSFEAARIIAGGAGVGYTIDYRDPWAFDMRTGTEAKRSPATRIAEERIVSQASSCVQVNDAIAEAYRRLFPLDAAKQHVVMNGFDPETIPPARGPYTGGPLNFGMLGTVTDLWPLGPIFEAWSTLRPLLPEGSMLRLGGYLGYFERNVDGLSSALPSRADGFIYQGPVPHAKVADFYADLDVIVVPLFGGSMVTAGKLFEVAATGRPFVCVQPSVGGGRRLLERHPFGFAADPEAAQIAGALKAAANLSMEVTSDRVLEVRQAAAVYERQALLAEMVDIVVSGAAR